MKNIILALMLVAGTAAHAGFWDDAGDALDPSKNGATDVVEGVGDALEWSGGEIADCFHDSQSGSGDCDGKIRDPA